MPNRWRTKTRITQQFLAERTGFEPAVGLPTHAFQACPLSRSGTSPLNACTSTKHRHKPDARRSTTSALQPFAGNASATPHATGKLSNRAVPRVHRPTRANCMAERAGFEPAIPVTRDTGFRDRRFQPLSHLSKHVRNRTSGNDAHTTLILSRKTRPSPQHPIRNVAS